MKQRLFIITLLCLLTALIHAETIILHTGARIVGTIVFENDDVIIVKDANGARFQYPRTDIAEILPEELNDNQTSTQNNEETIETNRKVSILLELSGGGAFIPNTENGGMAGVDLLIGSHHLADKHLFVGAGLGYHGLFIGQNKYNFIPIQATLRMPLIEQTHAPIFGLSLGYGAALSKDYKGGIYAGIDLGYRYQINEKTAITLTLFAQFQQTKIRIIEYIEPTDTSEQETHTPWEFENTVGRNLVTTGIKLGLYF